MQIAPPSGAIPRCPDISEGDHSAGRKPGPDCYAMPDIGSGWVTVSGRWRRKSGTFVGEVGYASLHRDIQPPLHMPEFGWVLATPFHGRGYATEAVRTATAWGDQQFGAQQTICIIDPENLRSIRVAEKCRFKVSHQASYKGGSIIVFAR